jgi:hypothetical protein
MLNNINSYTVCLSSNDLPLYISMTIRLQLQYNLTINITSNFTNVEAF